ncbi:MAG: hypothetical protein ABL970_08400 [Nitrospira sp.]
MTRYAALMMIGIVLAHSSLVLPAGAMTATQSEMKDGGAHFDGRQPRMLDRLLGQEATLVIGQYQPMGDIVPSFTKGHRTYSLFTSGLNGAAAPSVSIVGSSITVDLSSLFVGIGRGDAYQIRNIGGPATGFYDPETRAFSLSWQHLLDGRTRERLATFSLRGVIDAGTQPVAIPASLVLYATGLAGLGSWTWWRRRVALSPR